jgi:GNAT superfamily N-acetyltransferase
MALTFQRERFTSALGEEARPLIQGHHEEVSGPIADLPARIPFEHYEALESVDNLRVFTARRDELLVGYNVFGFTLHHQHGVRCAFHDTLFLHPSERKGTSGMRFLRFCDEQLKADGAMFVTQHVSAAVNIKPLLERMGYQEAETIYIKRLN